MRLIDHIFVHFAQHTERRKQGFLLKFGNDSYKKAK